MRMCVPSIVGKRRARVQTRLKVLLQNRLMESGWHDEMADYCRGARVLILPVVCVCVSVCLCVWCFGG